MSAPFNPMTGAYRLQVSLDSFTLSRGGDLVLSFDLDGRPLTWFDRGTLYKRSLSSQVLARRRDGGERLRWTLDRHAALEQFRRVHAWVSEANVEANGDSGSGRGASPLLARATRWTPDLLAAEGQRFQSAYAPISILPPDQYYSVVVQLTRGCSWNRCTFCTFYRDRPFTVLDPASLHAHLEAVHDLLGGSLALRRSIFLADGNALMLSNRRLLPAIAGAQRIFPSRPVHGFVDVFTGQKKSLSDWQALREAGVQRVYIGAETGHDPLLAWVEKPGSAATTTDFVTGLKAAGLQVGIILMTGLGGDLYAERHLQDSEALVRAMPLGPGDLVYLSPFVEHGPYTERARAEGVLPLPVQALAAQESRLRSVAQEAHPGVKVARYDIREFLY